MSNSLKHRQEKIQAKRKTTPWRQFVMEICSRQPLSLYRNNGKLSRYPTPLGKRKAQGAFFSTLQKTIDLNEIEPLLQDKISENSEYSDNTISSKNSYLSFTSIFSENVLYCFNIKSSSNVYNSIGIRKNSENIYSSAGVFKSFNVFYSCNIHNSNNIRCSKNLQGCTECINCDGLVNQSYYIDNKQYKLEEYISLKKEFLLKKIFTTPKRDNIIMNSEDIESSDFVSGGKTIRNGWFVGGGGTKELVYDTFSCGAKGNYYGCMSAGGKSEHIYCSVSCGESYNIFYSLFMRSCSYCLGCVNLTNKSYCIFNKQYTKEERHDKVDKILSQMEQDGTLGSFFPGSMNPFYFNDTAAYLIDDSFTKEEVKAAGYLRRDEEIKVDIPDWMDVVDVKDLGEYEGWTIDGEFTSIASTVTPNPTGIPLLKGEEKGVSSQSHGNRTIDSSILKKVIRDTDGNSYRVIKMEYDFLVKHGLPLPRKHRLERLKGHFKITK